MSQLTKPQLRSNEQILADLKERFGESGGMLKEIALKLKDELASVNIVGDKISASTTLARVAAVNALAALTKDIDQHVVLMAKMERDIIKQEEQNTIDAAAAIAAAIMSKIGIHSAPLRSTEFVKPDEAELEEQFNKRGLTATEAEYTMVSSVISGIDSSSYKTKKAGKDDQSS